MATGYQNVIKQLVKDKSIRNENVKNKDNKVNKKMSTDLNAAEERIATLESNLAALTARVDILEGG